MRYMNVTDFANFARAISLHAAILPTMLIYSNCSANVTFSRGRSAIGGALLNFTFEFFPMKLFGYANKGLT